MATIVASQRGAYDSFVQLQGETESRNIIELLNDLTPGQGETVGYFTISNPVADAPKDSDEFNYSPSSPPARILFVPTLEDLGYSAQTHKLQGIIFANLRSDDPDTDVQIRAVDQSGNLVAGSLATGTVTLSDRDDVVRSAAFDIAQNAGYAIDMRLVVDEAANVTLFNKMLFVRAVKI